MSRGRPVQAEAVEWQQYTQEILEVPSKPELGSRSVWHYDRNKTSKGPFKTEHYPIKGDRQLKFKPEKGKSYGKNPVVMVFKTSNRSNAKTKMKIWNNENIDYIITSPKLPGVPDKAEMLELGVGKNLIKSWRSKYSL
jgi:hypothetical protein|tara:strand:+ start:365 stop:778 length:414 start_codon:yes stop_codon:yes gene_type:complete